MNLITTAVRLAAAVLIAMALAVAPSLAQSSKPGFVNSGAERDAQRYEAFLKANINKDRTAAEWRAAGDRFLAAGKDFRAASRNFAAAVVADENDAAAWLGLARALLATPIDRAKGERFDLPANASGAAYRAYERAPSAIHKAQALVVLSEAFKRRSQWRPAIDALGASLELVSNAEAKEALELLRAEHGFRMLDYKIESDAQNPRVCLQFSEPVAGGDTDLTKFLILDGKDVPSISAEDRQICVDGLVHGKRYELTLRAGLPSAIAGEQLTKSVDIGIYVRDRNRSVRVAGNTYVLPSEGQTGLPLTSVNTSKVAVEIYRIGDRGLAGAVLSGEFQRQASSYLVGQIKSEKGERIWQGELTVANKLNEDVTTAFPIGEAVPQMKPGVYLLSAQPAVAKSGGVDTSSEDDEAEGQGRRASQWFIVSDLGLTALSGADGVHAFVRSLNTAEPQRDIAVRLIAKNNEVLATAKTDAAGYARFDAGLTRGEGGTRPAILVAERADADYAFLDLTTAAFDLTDRGVTGREPAAPLEAYVFTERGVYKPGENVHLTALVRDAELKAPRPVPVTLVLSRPDGVEHKRLQLEDQGFGGRAVSLALTRTAMTGTWRARIYADPKANPIGESAFLVEDFVPERLDLALEPKVKALSPDESGIVHVNGRYLYGAPAAGLDIEGEVFLRPRTSDLPGFPGYRFGQDDEKITTERKPLDAIVKTNDKGEADVAVDLPPLPRTHRPLEAQIALRLREPSGRAIERSVTLPVDTHTSKIGIKPLFDTHTGPGEGKPVAFELIMLDAKGKQAAQAGLKWQLQRIDTRWQWFSRDGSWNQETVKIARKIAEGVSDAKADGATVISTPVETGHYKLQISTSDPSGPLSILSFDNGWWGSESAETPEMLDVALDKPSYKAGDTAKLTIVTTGATQASKALVAVIGRGLGKTQEVAITGAKTIVDIPVDESWIPGAYVTAMVYRPLDEKAKRMPSRSIGVRWLQLDKASHALGVALAIPEKVAAHGKLSIPVTLSGLKPGEQARLVVSAVDVGILNLTRYEAPNPQNFFFGQRRLGHEIRDLYGRLIDGMQAEKGRLRSGGDESGGGLAMDGSPPVEAPLALYSGVLIPDAKGMARVDFDLPDFNGTVRVMAVAWSADRIGHAKADVIVRDPLALLVSAPRFMTLGDKTRVLVDLHNIEGPAGTFALTVTAEGGTSSQQLASTQVELASGQRKLEAIEITAKELGGVTYGVRITGPGGIDITRRLALDVKPPSRDIRRTTVSTLKANGGKLTLSADLAADLLPGKSKVTVSVGPAVGLDVAGLILALDRYPYGCAEQTTSKAMPLVYLNDLAKLAGLKEEQPVKERVQKAIERLFEMQDSSGAFGIWGPGSGDMWLTAYVSDFLTRAREAGYMLPSRGFGQALDRLQNAVNAQTDFEKGGEDLAYALYVLARNGRAPMGELRYYADTRIERFGTALAKTQIGAALSMMGDKERAGRAFKAAMASFEAKEGKESKESKDSTDDEGYRHDYGSALRDSAAMLTLVAETGMSAPEAPKLAALIGRALAGRDHTSTQENAWMLLAARSMIEDAKTASISVNGARQAGALVRAYGHDDLQNPITIVNEGKRIWARSSPSPAILQRQNYPSTRDSRSNARTTRSTASRFRARSRPVPRGRSIRTTGSWLC